MKKIESFFSFISASCLLIVFFVSFAQVIQRYVFHISIPWATDVFRIFFIYSVFSGLCVGLLKKAHLNIDVILQLVPEKVKPALGILSNLIVGFFLFFVLKSSIPFIMANADQQTPYLLFPMSYLYAIFPITAVVMLLFLFLDTVNSIKLLTNKKAEG